MHNKRQRDNKILQFLRQKKAFFPLFKNTIFSGRDFIAMEDHKTTSSGELNFKVGDVIAVAKCEGNLMNGYST